MRHSDEELREAMIQRLYGMSTAAWRVAKKKNPIETQRMKQMAVSRLNGIYHELLCGRKVAIS